MRTHIRQHPGPTVKFPNLKTFEAYRGYSVELNHFANSWAISKDGFHISWAQTLTEAREIIDQIA